MSSFTSTLGYTIGQDITATVIAINSVASSAESDVSNNDIVAQSVPTVALSNLAATSTTTSITMTWDALTTDTEIGYSTITSYVVIHDNGTPGTGDDVTRTVVITDGETTSFTGLTTGTSYAFTVSAANKHGTSATAPSGITYTAATIPAAPSAPVISQGSLSTAITFTWSTTATSNGLSVDSYKVLVLDRSSTPASYVENSSI